MGLGTQVCGLMLFAILARSCGCDCKQITAKCVDKSDTTSVDFGPSRIGTTSIGILNTHHFNVGDVIELIPPTAGATYGTGSRYDTLKYADTDFVADDPPSTVSQVISTEFDVDVDASLKAFTAQIKDALKNNTKLTLTAGSRHALAHPLDILANSSNDNVDKQIIKHPDRIYVLITGVVNAQELKLEYATSNSASGSVNILKIPGTKFSAEVTYNCSNVADLNSVAGEKKAGLAFFYTTVAAPNGKIDTVTTADLSKYALSNALL
jgi:hypothetical protein